LYFDRVLKELLAEHFSDSTRIISPYLRNKIYSPDYTETQLRIEPYYVWTPEAADQTPAIILTRGDWTPALHKLMGGYTIVSDSEAVAPMLWQGSHILNCVSSVPIESAELAFEVANFFISMRRPIEPVPCRRSMLRNCGKRQLPLFMTLKNPLSSPRRPNGEPP